MDLTLPTGTQTSTNGITVGTNINVNGILGGFATIGGTDWATTGSTGTTPITPLPSASYTNDAWAAGNNTNVTISSAPASDSKTNTLRFNTNAAKTLTLPG